LKSRSDCADENVRRKAKEHKRRVCCDISDSAESSCRIQHEKAEHERDLRDKAKLASKGLPLSDPGNRLSTNGAHDVPVNDEVHQTIDETESAIDNKQIDDEQSKETVNNGWKRVSRHENARKGLARIGEDKASD
jgi:hypothetical protein